MKRLILLLHFTFGILNFTFSQTAPGIEWQNTIGGSDGDELYSLVQTSDKGYILGGSSLSNISGDKSENCLGNLDYWIVKTDSAGNVLWQNTIGGNGNDWLFDVKQTRDGGYILGGFSTSNISGDKSENNLGGQDYWIVKTDSNGNLQWQNTIGGSQNDWLYSVQQTTDGGYILGGWSESDTTGDKTEINYGFEDFWVVKTDNVGNIVWQNTIGGSNVDQLTSLQQTTDGGYILGGFSYSNISGDKAENNLDNSLLTPDYWIVKIDHLGNLQWQNTIGGQADDILITVSQTTDSGYVLAGSSQSNASGDKTENCLGSFDYWVVKTNATGNIIWQNTIGGNEPDELRSIKQTADQGYILGGWSFSNISGDKTENNWDATLFTSDYWFIKTDSTGNIKWQKTLGGVNNDYQFCAQQTFDGGFVNAGYSNSNISGSKTENCLGNFDYWIIKLYPDTTTSISNIQPSTNNIQLFPNPAKDEITISGFTLQDNQPAQLKIFDIMGNEVYYTNISTTNKKLTTKNFANGVYFMQLQSGSKVSRAKFVKQ